MRTRTTPPNRRTRRLSPLIALAAAVVSLGACSDDTDTPDAGSTGEAPQSGSASPTPEDPADPEGSDPTAAAQAGQAVADFPDASSSGVPEATSLSPADSLTIDEDGTVIEGQDISGSVTVNADDVTIRNSRITSSGEPAVRAQGSNLVIEDSEIDGEGKAGPAVGYSDYTLRRVHIHNVQEGPRIAGGDVTIEDSLIDGVVDVEDNHTDMIQAVSGDNIVITGNNLQSYNPDSGTYGNAAFMYGEEEGPVTDCRVEGNLLNGGNYTINGGGGGTEGATCEFRDNAFQRDHRYGAAANLGPDTVWADSNVWLDSGEPVRN